LQRHALPRLAIWLALQRRALPRPAMSSYACLTTRLTHANMQMKKRGQIYSMNEANRQAWDAPLRAYIDDIQAGTGETAKKYSSRYIGSMVGDVHRTCAPP
jgi:fructose-1,6-bisphosphatase